MQIRADIDELLQLVSSVTEAYTTAFFLADNRRRVLRLWRYYSLGNNVIDEANIPYGAGPIGRVAESLKPFDLSKFSERDSALLRLYSRNEDIKSFFAVPVLTDEGLEGVLCIDSKKAFVFANKDQKLLTLFAKQFANLLNNIKVQKFVDTEASDVAFLHSFCSHLAAIDDKDAVLQLALEAVVELVECDSYFVSLKLDSWDDEESRYRIEAVKSSRNISGLVFSDQDGLAGCIIRGRESILLSNRRRELGSYIFTPSEGVGRVTSFLGIPLLTGGDVLGIICLVDGDEDAFNQRDLRVVTIVADNTSLAIANIDAQRKMHDLSTIIDGLTGLYNFSGFQQRFEVLLQAVGQRRRPLSLAIINIDNLKELNENSGYEAGNEVLRKFARLLMNLSEDENVIAARYGSSRFALILPGISKERAILVVDMLRQVTEDPTFVAPGQGGRVFISAGIASLNHDGRSRNDLIKSALQDLSRASTTGRRSHTK